MEPNKLPVITKRFWNVVRAALFMMRQSVSKKKLMLDLNLRLKRGKLTAAGDKSAAALHNLIHHHKHHHHPAPVFDPEDAFEFSFEKTPMQDHGRGRDHHALHYIAIIMKKLNKHFRVSASDPHALKGEGIMHAPPEEAAEEARSVQASPGLPGFGATPAVRQLRVTDSPFVFGGDGGGGSQVDADAERFISRFYEELRRQNVE